MNVPRLGGATGRKRPWLAGLLALVVTGLGHAYLRRWLRGFGWFAATFAAILLFVPPDVVEALNTGGPIGNPVEALPPVLVVVASAVDAYMLARRTHADAVDPAGAEAGAAAVGSRHRPDESAPSCPNCGKELDADLDFCPWCTTELEWIDADESAARGAGAGAGGRDGGG
ncbi:zinc ribbon domain-containing protein [Halobaculum gomorrense]|uniref:Zinc-ribbon domain-containing protein n=1 Tax=Halobaculum gomorrense TaxID=43928 RepID=A0A1M5KKM7_9EURY|nr:zinc ribbon domain-containing protein [Halobaculum gomorrense]SHG52723.1 zinc-ribbon domain-containing protein [Halobaculum gomorrense]